MLLLLFFPLGDKGCERSVLTLKTVEKYFRVGRLEFPRAISK